MVITRAPFRISFAGGGTDLPSFYEQSYGAVVSTSINKYVYVMVHRRSSLFGKGLDDLFHSRIRLSYSATESVQRPAELKHPIAREALQFLQLDEPMDIATVADVPAGSGLGSSSTFAVALLHALHVFKGEQVAPQQLAAEAAHIEINMLGRPVGKQDHYASACGGLNLIRFLANQDVAVEPLRPAIPLERMLFPHLLLLYTDMHRDAGSVLSEQRRRTPDRQRELTLMRAHAHQLAQLLNDGFDTARFGQVLHETWQQKRTLATTITNPRIDGWYHRAREAGAFGGKLCGAGGGGFLLFVVPTERRQAVRDALPELHELDIQYEPQGSQVLLNDGGCGEHR